jgi:phosphatidylglycerophosphate synthase
MVITVGTDPTALDDIIDAAAHGPVVVIAQDLVAPPAALAPVMDAEFAGGVLLVAPTTTQADLRIRHHVVVAAGSDFHRLDHANQRMVGALRLPDEGLVRTALDDLRAALRNHEVPPGDLFRLIVVALVRGGVRLRAVPIVDVPWFRNPHEHEAAQSAISSVSDARIAQLQANRIDDGFYSTFVVRKIAKPFTRVALRVGLKPNAITLLSFLIGIGAAASFAGGSWFWLLVGALLLQLSLVLDCVDGEVARATRTFTPFGAWLDALTDRVKELLVYAGLAFGAVQQDAWLLAIALVVLQTTRHMMDYDFSAVQRQREGELPIRDVRDPADIPGDWTTAFATISNPVVRWAKKVLYLPIGERWLIISAVALIAGPWWALMMLLGAGVIAFGYVLLGRIVRTRHWHGPTAAATAQVLVRQADALILRPSARVFAAPWGWTLPVLLRFVELSIVAAIVWRTPDLWILGFTWMAVVAFHDYDLLYRTLHGSSMPRWLTIAGLGWDGRTAVLIVALLIGILATVLGVGVVWLAVTLVLVASVQWLVTR